MKKFDWILFDLGGVLIEIDQSRCEQAFAKFSPSHTLAEIYQHDPLLFHNFDTGRISSDEFYRKLTTLQNITISFAEFKKAWNQLLCDFFPGRFTLLEQLRKEWKIALLSNTNPIHMEAIFTKHPAFASAFDEIILSYQTGFRKPQAAIFLLTARILGTSPQRILFIDDLPENITTAQKLGFHTYLLENPEQLDTEMYYQLMKIHE